MEPVIAPFADAIRFKRSEFAPKSYRIGMDVEQMGNFVYGKHLRRRYFILVSIFYHFKSLNEYLYIFLIKLNANYIFLP